MYSANELSVLSYANGFTLWHYRTPDRFRTLFAEGYFNDAFDMLRAGDMILVNIETPEFTPEAAIILVTKNSDNVVAVTNLPSRLA
jgi:hypothetical protein